MPWLEVIQTLQSMVLPLAVAYGDPDFFVPEASRATFRVFAKTLEHAAGTGQALVICKDCFAEMNRLAEQLKSRYQTWAIEENARNGVEP